MGLKISHPTMGRIKQVVSEYEDGVTVKVLAARLDMSQQHIMAALKQMEGVYVDRWARPESNGPGPWTAVWMVGEEENTPRPALSARTLRKKGIRHGIRP